MFNIFAGARRVAALVSVVAVAGVIWIAVTSKPYTSLDYSILAPGVRADKTTGVCPADATKRYMTRQLPSGTVGVEVCLLAMTFGQDRLIPYKKDEKGLIWGGAAYSEDVESYARRLEEDFQIPASDAAVAELELKQKYWSQLKEALLALGIGLAIFWTIVWGIGWIARGFLGIPRGKDRRDPIQP